VPEFLFHVAFENHADAIVETCDHSVSAFVWDIFVLDGGGVGCVDGDLALGESVCAPFADATCVEVVIASPLAADIGGVVWSPGAWSEPLVPVDFISGRLGFRFEPFVTHFGCVPGGNVGAYGVDFAESACSEEFVCKDEISLAEALCSGLIDSAVSFCGFDDRPAFGDCHAGRLFRINIFAGAHRHDSGEGVPAVSGGDEEGVEVCSLGEELAHVTVSGAVGVFVVGVDLLLYLAASFFSCIADSDKLHIVFAEHPSEVVPAASSDSYSAEYDAFAWCGST